MIERACRVCGCTQNNACLTPDGPCYWVEPDLCSGCAIKRVSPAADALEACRAFQATMLAWGMPHTFFPKVHRLDRPGIRPADSAPKSDDPTKSLTKVG